MWESENQDESPLMTTDNFHGIERLVKRDGMEATVVWHPPFDDWAVEFQGEVGAWKLLLWEPTHWKPL